MKTSSQMTSQNIDFERPNLGSVSVSVVVPTYKEAANLADLVRRLEPLRSVFGGFEVLIVDDNSQDGTEQIVESLNGVEWLRLIVRTANRGLSPSVIDGCRRAKNSVIVVMDADLSHPPESILPMVRKLMEGETDFVVGSRYVEGGKIDEDWSLFRHLNSLMATLLARPFTRIKDPMSGFFAFRREAFGRSADLNPIGYKIGLEMIVKCHFVNIAEVPITFVDRQKGHSKLSWREQLKYLLHIKRLLDYKFGNLSFLVQFALVGASGLVVNLIVVTLLNGLGLPIQLTLAFGILAGLFSNFALNRMITFDHGTRQGWKMQLLKFAAACSLGALINYIVSLAFLRAFPESLATPQLSVLVGVMAGLFSNFFLSRYLVFKQNLVIRRD